MSSIATRSTSAPANPLPLPVAFVKYYEKGSTVMGADQIAAALRERRWAAGSGPVAGGGKVPPGILVLIKTSRLDHLLRWKARGHRLVLDVQDTVVFKRHIKNKWLYDALIFKSGRQLADFGRKAKPDRVIYHQWDPRYEANQAPRARMALGSLGLPRSLAVWGELPDVEYVSGDAMFTQAPRFNCPLWIRKPGGGAL